ncbi:DUF218 domain-containing protein [Diaminobutyricimonas aerilata]|uniref:DUF218 domain-containing protein n=1 Tax=Diaminobutyricimonas aerilata TaxID=1162967 RepID=A0A2M9CFU2_9MICO|nr:YdcF family protein [Diaminobutyricimonas aerilata]PJJ70712.1 DUF218 domain-containing protein [Diaminobutyricimonas aerilata]
MRIRPLLFAAAALATRAHPDGAEAVVVLGYRNRGRRANYVNRYRVRAGLRSQRGGESSVLVLCGGAVGGDVAEAELMARYARERGYRGPLRLDRESRTTWENIRNAIPLIEHADAIKIVSNSLHAEKGRLYLAQMRPDLAERLVRADDYRFGEMLLLKPIAAVVGWRRRPRVVRTAAAAQASASASNTTVSSAG